MMFYFTEVFILVALCSDIHLFQFCGICVGATLFSPFTKILSKVLATNQNKIQSNVISNIHFLLLYYKVKLIANKSLCPTDTFLRLEKV